MVNIRRELIGAATLPPLGETMLLTIQKEFEEHFVKCGWVMRRITAAEWKRAMSTLMRAGLNAKGGWIPEDDIIDTAGSLSRRRLLEI